MKKNTTTTQKFGWVIFWIGVLYMFGLGWMYSWWVVPATNQLGVAVYSSDLVGLLWQLSVPMGAFIVAIGAALTTRAERRLVWLLILLFVIVAGWKTAYSSNRMVPALFGVGGGLITLFFIGSTWQWSRIRPTLTKAARTGSDLRMVGNIFFVTAAWFLCGLFGVVDFVLRPDLAVKFSVPAGDTINLASVVMVMLVLGWGFTFFGQTVARQAQMAEPGVDKVPQVAAAD